jgi:S-formylglutathione hydrolase FrmB
MSQRFFTTEISDPKFERDGLRFITIRTNNLPGRGDISVYVPPEENISGNVPIVILLHGVYGSSWCLPLKTGVHLIADKLIKEKVIRPMILAMPSDGLYRDGSAYIQHKDGHDFEKWIVEDVPDVIRREIKISSQHSPLFITGFSMGGYGAMRLGAKYYHLFNGFSGMSSITEFDQLANWYENENIDALENNVTSKPDLLQTLLQNKKTLGPFMFDCGEEDPLINANRKLHNDLSRNNIPHIFNEYPGEHNWAYWTEHIKEHLLFFNASLLK